jgi:hypothetical protein
MRRHFVPRVCLEPMEFQRGPSTPPKPNPANLLTQLALQRKWASRAVARCGLATPQGADVRAEKNWLDGLINLLTRRVYACIMANAPFVRCVSVVETHSCPSAFAAARLFRRAESHGQMAAQRAAARIYSIPPPIAE